jgi:enamine deaminase RidA (YjgF/YER057c/UK114 family)
MSAELRAAELGLDLSTATEPGANYLSAVRVGDLLFLAGHGPRRADGSYVTGKVGIDVTVEEGYEAARLTAIRLLATMRAELGSLDRVTRIVKLLCMVNCPPDFTEQPRVANGASDLLVEVFGEAGRHARSAVGMGSLPLGVAVEIELVAQAEGPTP